jgi:cephalosporin-C deacetylase-like acetyl esterase
MLVGSMNRVFCLLMLIALPMQAQTAVPSTLKLSARAERPTALYKANEGVSFNIALFDQDKPVVSGEVTYVLTKDGLPIDQQGKVDVVNGKAVVQGKLAEPGFLQLRAAYRSDPKAVPVTALAGAGIDVEMVKPSAPVPEDFDAFWTGQKAKLAAVPVNARLTSVSSTSKTLAAFDVQADCLGAPVSGYLVKPIDAKPKSLPIIMTVHGAGVSSSSLGGASGWAAKGFIAMDMNAHGLPNGKPTEYYKNLYATTMKDYRFEGRDSREKCYFTGMFLRLVRGLDVLTSQPEWDGKTVIVYGSSQGGYQAIVAAGLDPRVTFFGAGVPAGCDHTGMLANRIAGWPKLVPNGPDGKPDAKVVEASRYVDAMSFASRTKAQGCFFTVGFIDGTCPPTSVYAAYNAVTIPKQIYNDIPSGHANSREASTAMMKAALDHAARKE